MPSVPETPLGLDIAYAYFQSIRQHELHTAWGSLVAAALAHRILSYSLPANLTKASKVRLSDDGSRYILADADRSDVALFASHLLHTEFFDVFILLNPEARWAITNQAVEFAHPLLATRWEHIDQDGSTVWPCAFESAPQQVSGNVDLSSSPVFDPFNLAHGKMVDAQPRDTAAQSSEYERPAVWDGWTAAAITTGFDQPSLLRAWNTPKPSSSCNQPCPVNQVPATVLQEPLPIPLPAPPPTAPIPSVGHSNTNSHLTTPIPKSNPTSTPTIWYKSGRKQHQSNTNVPPPRHPVTRVTSTLHHTSVKSPTKASDSTTTSALLPRKRVPSISFSPVPGHPAPQSSPTPRTGQLDTLDPKTREKKPTTTPKPKKPRRKSGDPDATYRPAVRRRTKSVQSGPSYRDSSKSRRLERQC